MKAVDFSGTLRELTKPLDIARVGGLHGPNGGDVGHGIEPLDVFEAGAGLVVIAADGDLGVLTHPFRDDIGVGSVTDNIAETHNTVVFALGMGQDGLECLPVRVNVTQDQEAHRRIIATSAGAPIRTGTAMVPIPLET